MIELGNKCDLVPLSHALRVGQRDQAPQKRDSPWDKCGTSKSKIVGYQCIKAGQGAGQQRDKAGTGSGTRYPVLSHPLSHYK